MPEHLLAAARKKDQGCQKSNLHPNFGFIPNKFRCKFLISRQIFSYEK